MKNPFQKDHKPILLHAVRQENTDHHEKCSVCGGMAECAPFGENNAPLCIVCGLKNMGSAQHQSDMFLGSILTSVGGEA